MEKAYLFLRKLVALSLNVLIFLLVTPYIPIYYSIPVLLLVFSFIVSRISSTQPKELYNYKRSESYFTKGGLRDLARIPVVLMSFIHDLFVWEIWALFQILMLVVDVVYFIKQLVFWMLHALIWVGKLLAPFWIIVYKMFILYAIKWVWWIYRYSFNAIKKTYNWNIIKVSIIGAFIALFIFQLFYFLELNLDIFGLRYIGIVLALLPTTWTFGEIASIRGQNMLFSPFWEVRSKMKNGLESVRGLLFFITFFVVVLLAQAGLSLLGWMPKTGAAFLGFSLNISFIFNIILILLAITIFFSSFVLPSFRLYNEFNETSFRNVYELFTHLIKRSLQYIAGFIPSSFFASIAIIPPAALIALALFLTMQVKENITEVKISKVTELRSNAPTQIANYRLSKEIDRLEQVKLFPKHFLQNFSHRNLLENELSGYETQRTLQQTNFAEAQKETNKAIEDLSLIISSEKEKAVVNQTRIDEANDKLATTKKRFDHYQKRYKQDVAMLDIDIEYTKRKYRQQPILLYLSGLFMVVVSTLIFAFAFAYYGNYFYRAFLFRNDDNRAKWKDFIREQKEIKRYQPLLSTTLNIIIILALLAYVFYPQST